jgi:hypothetical protein
MRRNGAQALLRGFGTWWMDLPGGNWFGDARIWEVQRELNPLEERLLARRAPFQPEIAAVVGQDAMCHLTGGSSVLARPLVYESRAALGRSGAPYGQYLLDDAVAGRIPGRLQFFLAAWSLTPAERDGLRDRRRPGTTRVWCHAPGYSDGTRRDPAFIRETCGFQVREATVAQPVATPTERGRELGLTESWGQKVPIAPLFAVVPEAGDEVLATYADGSPALVARVAPTGTDIFLGTPALTSELVRVCARLAGVHLFCESDAAVWAVEGLLSVHAVADGPLNLQFPATVVLRDAVDGRVVGEGTRLEVPFRKGETRVFASSAP